MKLHELNQAEPFEHPRTIKKNQKTKNQTLLFGIMN